MVTMINFTETDPGRGDDTGVTASTDSQRAHTRECARAHEESAPLPVQTSAYVVVVVFVVVVVVVVVDVVVLRVRRRRRRAHSTSTHCIPPRRIPLYTRASLARRLTLSSSPVSRRPPPPMRGYIILYSHSSRPCNH